MSNETLNIIMAVGGGVITILNMVVAFFLKSIHGDFKTMGAKVTEHNERLVLLEYRIAKLDGEPQFQSRRSTGS